MTLFDAIVGATRQMGVLETRITSTTGNTTSALIQTLRSETADDQFNEGTFFILSATAASTAIAGQFRPIQDYVASSGEFRWASSVLAAVPAGADVGYLGKEFRTPLLIELANDALRSLGPLTFVDRTTLQTSAVQTAYSGSVSWKYAPPSRIDVLTGVGTSTTDPDWYTITNWHYQPSTAGAAGLIVFDEQLPVSRDVRVWYEDHHHRITASTQAVDERFHPELVVAALVEKLYEYRNSRSRGGDAFDVQRWGDAKLKLQQAKVLYPTWQPKKKRKLVIVGHEEDDHLPYPAPYGP